MSMSNKMLAREYLRYAFYNDSKSRITSRKGSNFFFDELQLFSWGRHFTMAEVVKVNGKRLIVVNNHSYSVSTNRHRGHLINAMLNNGMIEGLHYVRTGSMQHTLGLLAKSHKDFIADIVKEYDSIIKGYEKAQNNARKEENKIFYAARIEEVEDLVRDFKRKFEQ